MDLIFLKLLNMSIAAGWLICAVLLLRPFLKKAPKRIHCLLWGIAAVRLVCPISLNAPFSLIPSSEVLDPHVVQYAQKPTVNTGVLFLNRTLNPLISQSFAPAPGASANPLHIWVYIAGLVWACGAVLLLGYGVFRYIRLCIGVREAVPFVWSAASRDTVSGNHPFPAQKAVPSAQSGGPSQAEASIKRNLWLCDAVTSPFILGLLKPRIYLPSGISETELRYVIAHEQVHLQRKDHWRKLLGYFLLSVYWFHPLVWAAYHLFCRDLELACDEDVIRGFDLAERKAYANALVSCGMQRRMVLACPLAFGEIDIKERVDTVLHYRAPALWKTAAAAACCIVLAVCFLTDPPVSEFSGSRTGNDSEFIMEFQKLNTADSQELTLEAGDVLHAVIAVDDGRIAVTIRKGDEMIYENREMISSDAFDFEIAESGVYTVEVSGEHARGSVRFVRELS